MDNGTGQSHRFRETSYPLDRGDGLVTFRTQVTKVVLVGVFARCTRQ